MSFKLHILGCGASVPSLERNASAQLLEINQQYFLIDCAEGTQQALRKQHLSINRIDHVFISHLHGDHYLGLVGLLLSMNLLDRQHGIHIYAHAKLLDIIHLQLHASSTHLNYSIHFHHLAFEQEETLIDTKDLVVSSFPLQHRIPCCGFIFKEKTKGRQLDMQKIKYHRVPQFWYSQLRAGEDFINDQQKKIDNEILTHDPLPNLSYAYCSDTLYSESILPYIQYVDLLYHEATFMHDLADRAKETHHSTAEEAARIALLAGAKELLLGHFSLRYGSELKPLLAEAQAVFKNSMLAYDGLQLSLRS